MGSLFLIIILSYLVGSFPTSVVFGRMSRRIDIREYGSGNAGGTNAIRVLGWKAGLLVALIDIGKGALAALLISRIRVDALMLDPELVQIIAGTSAVIGHIWTVLAKFKGGKGVATAGGMLIAIYPWVALICFLIFLTIAITTRYVSVGSISAATAVPFVLLILEYTFNQSVSHSAIVILVLLSALIFFTHRSNIRRLMNGTENRFDMNSIKNKLS